MDFADHASQREQAERDAAIEAAVSRTPGQTGSECCHDCADPIPAARRAANPTASRCIDCQTRFEGS